MELSSRAKKVTVAASLVAATLGAFGWYWERLREKATVAHKVGDLLNEQDHRSEHGQRKAAWLQGMVRCLQGEETIFSFTPKLGMRKGEAPQEWLALLDDQKKVWDAQRRKTVAKLLPKQDIQKENPLATLLKNRNEARLLKEAFSLLTLQDLEDSLKDKPPKKLIDNPPENNFLTNLVLLMNPNPRHVRGMTVTEFLTSLQQIHPEDFKKHADTQGYSFTIDMKALDKSLGENHPLKQSKDFSRLVEQGAFACRWGDIVSAARRMNPKVGAKAEAFLAKVGMESHLPRIKTPSAAEQAYPERDRRRLPRGGY